MNISALLGLNSLKTIGGGYTGGAPAVPTVAVTTVDFERIVLADAFAHAIELRDSLSELDRLLSTAQLRQAHPGRAMSSQLLGLGEAPLTATTLRSSAEVNATPRSFSPFGPDWDQPAGSTAEPTIDGIYDGSNGTGTLTFEARSTGTHGSKNLKFEVFDPADNEIDNFQVKVNDPLDKEYTLSNGLIFTLGAGTTVKNDTFTIEVFADVGSSVDPDKPFNGVRNDNPNLEYGLQVTAGSFEVNGEVIPVNASDTINDVLARIDASAAGVSATFDIATEHILLTQKSMGSAFDITLANDSSGFLLATKLDTASADPGTDGGVRTPLSELSMFAAVSSGTLRINDVDIALDVTVDSLEDVLARIDASSAAASARMNNDRVLIEAGSQAAALKLDDGGTGLFDALHISTGLHQPVARAGITQASANQIASAVVDTRAGLDNLYRGNGKVPAILANLRGQVSGALATIETDLARDTQLQPGLTIDSAALFASPLAGVEVDQLVRSLQLDFSAVRALFVGDSAEGMQGFVRQLLGFLNQFTASTRGLVGTQGLRVDLFV